MADHSSSRKIAEKTAEDPRNYILRRNYLEGGGSPTDFITDLAGAIEVALDEIDKEATNWISHDPSSETAPSHP